MIYPFLVQTCLSSPFSTQQAINMVQSPCAHIWCPPSSFYSLLHHPDPSFPLLHLPPIPPSSPPTTSDPFLPFLCPPLIPLFHTSRRCDPSTPQSCEACPCVCELLVQEPACVVAPGQRWHSPAGMRGNRVWAFLYKRTIKPTAVHNELILIQVRCTSCVLSLFSLLPFLVIDYTVYLVFLLCRCLFVFSPVRIGHKVSAQYFTTSAQWDICHVGALGHLRHFVEVLHFCTQVRPPSSSHLSDCNLSTKKLSWIVKFLWSKFWFFLLGRGVHILCCDSYTMSVSISEAVSSLAYLKCHAIYKTWQAMHPGIETIKNISAMTLTIMWFSNG